MKEKLTLRQKVETLTARDEALTNVNRDLSERIKVLSKAVESQKEHTHEWRVKELKYLYGEGFWIQLFYSTCKITMEVKAAN